MKNDGIKSSLVLGMIVATAALASAHQAAPPIRTLAPPEARTMQPARALLGVIELPGRRLLVNDAGSRQLLLFDSTLKTFTVLRDSAAGQANGYGPRPAILIPYLADSVLFVDNASQTLILIDPQGRFGRVMAVPNPRDLPLLTRMGPATDAKGRLVYQGGAPLLGGTGVGNDTVWWPPTDPMLRADFDTRRVDTIGAVGIHRLPARISSERDGRRFSKEIVNPLQALDGWAITRDGSVALVRGHDYHIDWIHADGTTTTSPKMPFDWKRLGDDDKQRLIDSASAVQRARDALPSRGTSGGTAGCIRTQNGRDVIEPCRMVRETAFVTRADIPDYYPPIRAGAVRADVDNNVWILPTTTAQSQNGELVYDVVNRKGELFERVRIPPSRSIAGFGRGGTIYLMWRDQAQGWFIERARVVRP